MNIGNVLTMMVSGNPIPNGAEQKKDTELFDINYIITNKPPIKEVREFMRFNLANIKSEEEIMFDK